MRGGYLGCLLALSGCRDSSTEVARQVIEQAVAIERNAQGGLRSGPASTERCVPMAGELLAATHDWSIDRHVWRGSLYWPTQNDLRVLRGTSFETVMTFEHTATSASPSDAGWFVITQDDEVRTRLVWRTHDGDTTTYDAPEGWLLGEVLAVADGAYVDAGQTSDSPGPASRVLHLSAQTGRLSTVVDRTGGVVGIRYDEGTLYWIEYPQTSRGQSGAWRIIAHKPGTTVFRTIAENSAGFDTIELHDEWIYWIESGHDFEAGPIMRAPKAGGPATRVHRPAGHSLAFSGDTLLARAGGDKIVHIDPSTGASEVFLQGAPLISLPVVGTKDLYWTAATADTQHVADVLCIYRSPRPR